MAMLMSLAGIPLTAGFVGKLVIINVNVSASEWMLVGGIVISSLIGAFYYLRVMGLLLEPAPTGAPAVSTERGWMQPAGGLLLLAVSLLTIGLGIFPEPLFDWARQFVLR